MNQILQEIFGQYKVNFNCLTNYGFIFNNDYYEYVTNIVDGSMKLTVKINVTGNIETEVYDLESEEIYTLFLAESASGVFVGEVKKAYEKALIDIRDKCFTKTIFTSDYALQIIDYIKNKYEDNLEFLWAKSPNNAIWRRKDNSKWYCALLTTKEKSLGLDGDKIAEIIDFMENPQIIQNIIDMKNYFPAYHMNKKYWLTIRLDGCSLPIEKVFEHIDRSYMLANKKASKIGTKCK